MDFHTIDLNKTVVIVLEETGARFTMHKDALCSQSPFATACLNGAFKEAETQELVIGDWTDEVSVLSMIAWCYQGQLALDKIAILPAATTVRLMTLYLLADRLLMIGLKNDIIDVFPMPPIHSYNYVILFDIYKYLVEEGPEECKLKQYLDDQIALVIHDASKNRNFKTSSAQFASFNLERFRIAVDVCPELGIRIMKKLTQIWQTTGMIKWPKSKDYHEEAVAMTHPFHATIVDD